MRPDALPETSDGTTCATTIVSDSRQTSALTSHVPNEKVAEVLEFENLEMLKVGAQLMTPHFYLGHVAGLGSLASVWGRWRRQKSWRLKSLIRNGLPHGPGVTSEPANGEDQLSSVIYYTIRLLLLRFEFTKRGSSLGPFLANL